MKECKELGTFFALIDIIRTHLQQTQAPKTHEKVWSKGELLPLEEDCFREHLNKLDMQKSTGPGGSHIKALAEFGNVSARLDNL